MHHYSTEYGYSRVMVHYIKYYNNGKCVSNKDEVDTETLINTV